MTEERITALSAKDLAKRLGIGRDKSYSLMRSNGFPSILLGKRYIVTEDALRRWLQEVEGKTYSIDKGKVITK